MDLPRLPLPSLLMPNLARSARSNGPVSSLKGPQPSSLVLSCSLGALGHPCPQNFLIIQRPTPSPWILEWLVITHPPPKPSRSYSPTPNPSSEDPLLFYPITSKFYPSFSPSPREDPQLAYKERNPS